MADAFIYDHVRSPRGRGKDGGGLQEVQPVELMSQMLRAIRDRNDLDTRHVDDVVVGCGEPVGDQGSNIGRISVLNAAYDESVSGKQLQRFCASGLDAVNTGAAQIMAGQADMTIGGGVECMSRYPMGAAGGAWYANPGISHAASFIPQGVSADLIASKYGMSRNDLDSYAVESQKRAKNAWDNGYFDASVVPIVDQLGATLLDHDEHMRPGTTVEDLAKLKPSFEVAGTAGFNSVALLKYSEVEKIQHCHHAGNSSGIVDGAAAVLMGSKDIGAQLGLKPRARIVSFATIGTEPTIMLTGPAPAAEKALRRAGLTVSDIDLHELNEAFAAVVLRYMQVMNVNHDEINLNGGAIAMGHPIAATGAMVLGIALDELERRNLSTALVSLCVGAGMGIATIIERV